MAGFFKNPLSKLVGKDKEVSDQGSEFESASESEGQPRLTLVGPPRRNAESSDEEAANVDDLNIQDMDIATNSEKERESTDDGIDYRGDDFPGFGVVGGARGGGSGRGRKRGKPLGHKQRNEFIPETKARTVAFTTRGRTIRDNTLLLQTLTGCKAFVKLEYSGGHNQAYSFVAGENFKTTQEQTLDIDEPGGPTTWPSDLKKMVKEAVQDGIRKSALVKPSAAPVGSARASRAASSAIQGFPSPTAPKPKRKKAASACTICEQDEENHYLFDHHGKPTRSVITARLMCSFEEKGVPCTSTVHTYCLGFIGVKEDVLEDMPDWYCRQHYSAARDKLKVKYGKAKN